ncbi:MAG: Gfo/Idh/MocA family oxidoreductase [Gemmataceae bacterium]
MTRRDTLATFAGAPILFAAQATGRIKVGQIGTTHAHATKLSVYRESADYEVVGVVEPDADARKRAEATAAFKGVKWLPREELLAAPGLQAVLVETPVRDLLDNAEACVNAGLHVHIDKPAGASFPQFRRILDTAARKKLLVQMGYMYRYNPGVVLLREFLKNGWLGDVFEVHAVMSKVVDPASRRKLAEFKGGIFFELGCHVLDLVVAILGKPEHVTSVNRHSATDDTLQDNMLGALSYPKAIATVKSSAIEVNGGDRRQLAVCGAEGTFHIRAAGRPCGPHFRFSKPRGRYKAGVNEIRFRSTSATGTTPRTWRR